MTAMLVAAAIIASIPRLPVSDGLDHTADEIRLEFATKIRAHDAYTRHIHKVWRRRRQAQAVVIEPVYSGSWAPELRAAGFPESAIPTMLYYISRESGGDPNAVNPTSGACGLLQLYPCYGGAAWLDPMTNLRVAFAKYEAAGFAPWGG